MTPVLTSSQPGGVPAVPRVPAQSDRSYTPPYSLNVRDARFGAVGDGSTDDSAAFQAAINAAPQGGNARGVRIITPPGDYVIDAATLNLVDKFGILLEGVAGPTQTQPRLRRSAAAGPIIDARGTQGLALRNLSVQALNPAYADNLIQFGVGAGNTSLVSIEDCWICGVNGGAGQLVVLDAVTEAYIRGCSFQFGNYGVVGRVANFSNNVTVDGCTFNFMAGSGVRNPQQAWSVSNCSFEPRTDGKAGAVSSDAVATMGGFNFIGNWCGDITVAGGFFLDNLRGFGMLVAGNYFKQVAGATHLSLNAPEGLTVVGNLFDTGAVALNIVAGTARGVTFKGNRVAGITTPITGTITELDCWGNYGITDQIAKYLSSSAAWDPPSVAAGAQTTQAIAVVGAALGDPVTAGFNKDLQGMQLDGYVSAADIVTVILRNGTAGAIDLAAGTLRVGVWKHS